MQLLEERFTRWAERCPDIRAALVVGSRARRDHPADILSDLDIAVLSTHPERYLGRADWLGNIGIPLLTFIEETGTGGGLERRALFQGDGGLDVDFSVYSTRRFRLLLAALQLRRLLPGRRLLGPLRRAVVDDVDGMLAVLNRGYRVLLDKDGLLARILMAAQGLSPPPPALPSREDFVNLCNDFWYHALWAAKKLARGEVWTAKACCDSYMKRQVLTMITWQARTRPGRAPDTWHGGRFLEEWADPRVIAGLSTAYAHYDREDLARALISTMDLFRWVGEETAQGLGYDYPRAADEDSTALVIEVLEALQSGGLERLRRNSSACTDSPPYLD